MVKCFVTGGNGFVGSHIVRQLAEKGHDLTLLLRGNSNTDLIEGVEFRRTIGDVTDLASLENAIPDDCEWLFHNAAIMSEWGSRDHFYPVNVEGTRNILEIMQRKDIPYLIHTSSTAVYGFPDSKDPVTEEREWNPPGNYQKSKTEAEALILEYEQTYGIKATRVRPPTVLGHGDLYTGPQFIERVKQGSMAVFGKGDALQSYVHGSDVGKCIVLAAENHDKSMGNAYNVVSFIATFREFLEQLAEELDAPKKFRSIPYGVAVGIGKIASAVYSAFRRKNPPVLTDFLPRMFGSDYVISNQKARDELGFVPDWDLDSTVKDMVAWGGYVKPR